MHSTPPADNPRRAIGDPLAIGIVAALTALTVALGVLRLDDRSIWLDEGNSIWYALHTWRALLDQIVHFDPNMSFYYWLLWFWRHLFGSGVFAMRALSVVFAALTVPAAYILGRRMFDTRAGVVTAALVVVNGFFLTYAQEARAYALVTLLVTISSYFFYGQLATFTRRDSVGYVVLSALAFYAHFFAAFVILSQAAYLVWLKRRDAFQRRWLAQYAAIVLLILPILYPAISQRERNTGWFPAPSWSTFFETLRSLAGGTNALLLVYGAIGVGAVVLAIRSPVLRPPLGFLATWLVLPIALAFAISLLNPILLPKYLIVSFPALMVLGGCVLTNLPRPIGVALAVVFVGLSILGIHRWYDRPPVTNWKAVADYIATDTHHGDGVILHSVWFPYEYYADRSGRERPVRIAQLNEETLKSITHPRVWLVFANADNAPPLIRAALEKKGYATITERSFGEDLRVELMARRAG